MVFLHKPFITIKSKKDIQDIKVMSTVQLSLSTEKRWCVKGFSALRCLLSNSPKVVFHLPTIKLQVSLLPITGPVHDFVALASLTPLLWVASTKQTLVLTIRGFVSTVESTNKIKTNSPSVGLRMSRAKRSAVGVLVHLKKKEKPCGLFIQYVFAWGF